jgi:HEAT repeat protein
VCERFSAADEQTVSLLDLVAFVLSGCSILMLGVLVARRTRLAAREQQQRAVQDRLKPVALELVHAGVEPPGDLGLEAKEALADLLGRYARATRGPTHERIVAYFEREGTIARELASLAETRRAWRRATAAFRLGDIGNAEAAGGLIAALRDPARDVRVAAARSLGRLHAAQAGTELIAAAADRRIPAALARWALLQIGMPVLPQMRALLRSEDERERAGAVQLIGLLGGPADADAAEERIRDSAALVRAQAALALGRLGSARNLPALLGALEDRIPQVREAAATALGEMRDPRSVEALADRVERDRFEVARAAAHALVGTDSARAAERAAATGSIHLLEAVDLAAVR